MPRLNRSRSLRNAALAAVLVAVAGCQAPLAAPIAPTTSVIAPAAAGAITVPLAALLAGARGRHVLGTGFAEAAIVQARLVVTGPGIASPVVSSASWAAGDEPPASLTVSVPAGPNRLIAFEGLDAEGHALGVMRTIATVAAGEAATLALNANTDAAGRVIEALLAGPDLAAGDSADVAGIGTTLETVDLTADLQAYVSRVTGYDASANTYSGVAPAYFRSTLLANRLREGGKQVLFETAIAPEQAQEARATHTLYAHRGIAVVGDPAGEGAATFTVFDPFSVAQTTDWMSIGGTFSDLPPGTWTVRAEHDGDVVWTTLRVRDTEQDGQADIQLPARPGTHLVQVDLPALPSLLAVDGQGAVWAASASGMSVTKLSAEGALAGSWGLALGGEAAVVPHALAGAGAGGAIALVEAAGELSLRRIAADGAVSAIAALGSGPAASHGLALGADGAMVVTLGDRVIKLDAAGSELASFRRAGAAFADPGLTPEGLIWVRDAASGRALQLSADLFSAREVAPQAMFSGFADLAVDGAGRAWMAVGEASQLEWVAADLVASGAVRGDFSYGIDRVAGDGQGSAFALERADGGLHLAFAGRLGPNGMGFATSATELVVDAAGHAWYGGTYTAPGPETRHAIWKVQGH